MVGFLTWCTTVIAAASTLAATTPVSNAENCGGAQLAYMVERGDEKQIVIARADGSTPRQLTSGPLWHLYPRLDSTGKYVAYVEGKDQRHLAIVTQHLASGLIEQWTAADGMYLHPHFSGNGRYLAFAGPLGPDGRSQIGIIDLEAVRNTAAANSPAGNMRRQYQVTPRTISSEFPCYFPALSSDGSFVVFQRTKKKSSKDIVLLDLGTQQLTPLSPAEGVWMSPSLSWEDRFVAYTGMADGSGDVFIIDRYRKTTQRITQGKSRQLAPAFRPDGGLLLASDRRGHFELYEIPAPEMRDGTFRQQLLVGGDGQYYAPSSSGESRFEQSELPSLPEPARSSFGAVKLPGRIYIAGGHQGPEHTYPPESFLSQVDGFDLSTNAWHALAPLPIACHGFSLAAQGKYLYAFGGFAYSAQDKPAWKSLDTIQRYDTETNRWETLGTMPRRRSSYALAQLGTKVYLLGGWDSTPQAAGDKNGRFHREVDCFDLTTERMTAAVARLPDPLRRALSCAVLGGEIVLLGGLSPGATHFELVDNVTAYSPETGAWRELPPLPFATFAPAAGVMDGQLVLFGGMFKTGPMEFVYVDHVFSLATGAHAWQHTGRYLREARGFSQVVPLRPEALAILGGHADVPVKDAPVRTFEVFGQSSKK
jgi:hypothetical protein